MSNNLVSFSSQKDLVLTFDIFHLSPKQSTAEKISKSILSKAKKDFNIVSIKKGSSFYTIFGTMNLTSNTWSDVLIEMMTMFSTMGITFGISLSIIDPLNEVCFTMEGAYKEKGVIKLHFHLKNTLTALGEDDMFSCWHSKVLFGLNFG